PPVAERVHQPALSVLLGRLIELAPGAASALGGFHDLLFPGVMGDAVLDAWHGRSSGLEQAADAREISRAHEAFLLEPVLPLARLLGQDVRVIRVAALELPGSGAGETLHRGALGLLLRHRAPYFGAITIVMLRPSSLASLSILPMSASVAATRSSTARPSSRW